VVVQPPREQWEDLRLPKMVIYKNAGFDFLRFMNSKFELNAGSATNVFGNRRGEFYYSGTHGNRPKFSILFQMDHGDTIDEIEMTLITNYSVPQDQFKDPESIESIKQNIAKYQDYENAVHNTAVKKEEYVRAISRSQEAYEIYKLYLKRVGLLKKAGIANGVKYFIFEDVLAEDTCCDGDDIDLGMLKFKVDFNTNNVRIEEGSEPRSTPWGSTFHPHDLNDTVCLGSQSADMTEAITNIDVDVIQALLYKFAHSYTSSDSAGENWKKWTTSYEEEVYSEYHGENIPVSEAAQLDNGDWIRQEDSVILRDGRRYPRGWTNWSEYYDGYIDEDTSVWSNHLDSYIEEEDDYTIQLLNGDWSVSDHDEVFEYDGNYYLEDETIEDINGNIVPKRLVVYSQVLQQHILSTEAIMRDGEYYTQDTLPETLTEGTIG
jgi:hypothetical protein